MGLTIVNNVCTGWPSRAPNSIACFEKAERDHRPQDVHHDRIADVRHGDAVAQRRGTERLPCQQHLEQELAVNLLGQGHDLDQRLEHGKLVRAAEPIVDAACFEGFRQTHGGAAAVGLGKDIRRDIQALRSRPFEQFRPIEAILVIDPIGRQLALLDPTVNRFFGYFEQLRGIADTQIHRALQRRRRPRLWTNDDKPTNIATFVQRVKVAFSWTRFSTI